VLFNSLLRSNPTAAVSALGTLNPNANLLAAFPNAGFAFGNGVGTFVNPSLALGGAGFLSGAGASPFLTPFPGGGYGGLGYGGGGGGGGLPAPSPGYAALQAQNYFNDVRAAEQPRRSDNLLSAFGIPNDEGKVEWPVGLRVIGPAGVTDPLRQRVDTLVSTLLGQRLQYGQVDGALVQETTQSIDALKRHLAERSTDLSRTSYQDSRNFLDRLQEATRKME